jgi:hypothetical protein
MTGQEKCELLTQVTKPALVVTSIKLNLPMWSPLLS